MFQTKTVAVGVALATAGMLTVGATAQAQTTPAAQVTFTKDVAPILQRSCQTCHRPGTMAPMSLLSYQDARPWARSIKAKVTSREMPPWFVDRNIGIQKFKNDPSLSEKEIETLVKWVDAGAPQGNPADMPPPKKFDDMDMWHIKPDMIVKMPKPYRLKANGRDEFLDVTIDPGFDKDFFVSAI